MWVSVVQPEILGCTTEIWQFGYQKVRFKGMFKNTALVLTLFALSKLWMAPRTLLVSAGEVRL